MPIFSEDDVMNFKITEAIVHRVAIERLREKTVAKTRKLIGGHKKFGEEHLITHGGR